jgi:hypothetical protein
MTSRDPAPASALPTMLGEIAACLAGEACR